MDPCKHKTVLCDLPDSCLLHIFKHLCPLPDKFSVGASCWRFYRLVSDRRMWLAVSPTGAVPQTAPGGAGPVYPTLDAAVEASRPGDTIWLAPGVPHTASDLDIPWPLHLLGGGLRPQDTTIRAPQGADCALSILATAKLAHLSISTTLCPCVTHKRGSLTLQDCVLTAEPKGLYHLVSPVLTLAVSSTATAAAAAAAAPANADKTAAGLASACACLAANVSITPAATSGRTDSSYDDGDVSNQVAPEGTASLPAGDSTAAAAAGTCSVTLSNPPCAASKTCSVPVSSNMMRGPQLGIGTGKLQVVECQLMGGSTAVRCGGSGVLRNVRAIYKSCSRAPYLWLEVDSGGAPLVAAGLDRPTAQDEERYTHMWRAAGAFLLKHQQEVAAATAATAAMSQDSCAGSNASKLLQARSKAWHQQRAQHVMQPEGGQQVVGLREGCPTVGLARIHAVLAAKSINPTSLAAHLHAKQQQQ